MKKTTIRIGRKISATGLLTTLLVSCGGGPDLIQKHDIVRQIVYAAELSRIEELKSANKAVYKAAKDAALMTANSVELSDCSDAYTKREFTCTASYRKYHWTQNYLSHKTKVVLTLTDQGWTVSSFEQIGQ